MFGLLYAILGMISGIICSLMVHKENKESKDWYIVGQVLPIISIVFVFYIVIWKKNAAKMKDLKDSSMLQKGFN